MLKKGYNILKVVLFLANSLLILDNKDNYCSGNDDYNDDNDDKNVIEFTPFFSGRMLQRFLLKIVNLG